MASNERIKANKIEQIYFKEGEALRELTHEDLFERDVTQEFMDTISFHIRKKIPLRIKSSGQSSKGKSTGTLLLITNDVMERLNNGQITQERAKQLIEELQILNQVASDGIEATRIMNETRDFEPVMIDDYSELNETGANSSAEKGRLNSEMALNAQNHNNMYFCSISRDTMYNTYCQYELIVISRVDETKEIIYLLYYQPDTGTKVPVGKVVLDVSSILNTPLETKYREKKVKRMRLLKDKGIRDIRELEAAYYTRILYDRMKDFPGTKESVIGILGIALMKILREQKAVFSMVSEGIIITRTSSLLALTIAKRKEEAKLLTPKNNADQITKAVEIMQSYLDDNLKELDLRIKIMEEYHKTE